MAALRKHKLFYVLIYYYIPRRANRHRNCPLMMQQLIFNIRKKKN